MKFGDDDSNIYLQVPKTELLEMFQVIISNIKYIYVAGLSPKEQTAMQRYREDFEAFLSMYPAGAAS